MGSRLLGPNPSEAINYLKIIGGMGIYHQESATMPLVNSAASVGIYSALLMTRWGLARPRRGNNRAQRGTLFLDSRVNLKCNETTVSPA